MLRRKRNTGPARDAPVSRVQIEVCLSTGNKRRLSCSSTCSAARDESHETCLPQVIVRLSKTPT